MYGWTEAGDIGQAMYGGESNDNLTYLLTTYSMVQSPS